MNPSTNAARRRFPPDQSRDFATPSHHKPHDKVEQAEMDLPKGNWYWDIRSDTTVWSEPLYGIIGRENAAIPPFREHFCFHTSESWIRLVDATLDLLQTGAPYELRLQMLRADGTRRWVIRNGEAVRNERGDILELRGTVQDISERMAEFVNAERDWRTKSSAEDTTSQLIQAQEEDNEKRASELRDKICQRVALLAVEIQSFGSTVPDLSAEAQAQLESLWQDTTEILAELHRVSDRLYPLILDLLGLPSAVRSLCRKFMSEHRIPVECICSDVPANRLNKQSRLVLYRTLEEILTSIASHSSANNVTVGLHDDSVELRLRVSDNGVGFEQANAKTVPGLGLTRIKAQLEQIGGSLAVWSEPGSGTLIEARTPLSDQGSPKLPGN